MANFFYWGFLLFAVAINKCPAEDVKADYTTPEGANGSDWIYMKAPNNSTAKTARATGDFSAAGANSQAGGGAASGSAFAVAGSSSQLLEISRKCGILPTVPPSNLGNCAPGEYPFIVAILTWDNKFLCSGALISDSIVLTTASPIVSYSRQNQPLKVILGAYSIPEMDPHVLPQKEVFVSAAVIQSDFNENSPQNNIALLRLFEDINFDQYPHVFPICITQLQADYNAPKSCKVLGWPDLPNPRPDWRGNSILANGVVETLLQGCSFGNGVACAKGNVCNGNSGSPVVCDSGDGRYFLWGIILEEQTCDARGPANTCPVVDIYTNMAFISKYYNTKNPNS